MVRGIPGRPGSAIAELRGAILHCVKTVGKRTTMGMTGAEYEVRQSKGRHVVGSLDIDWWQRTV